MEEKEIVRLFLQKHNELLKQFDIKYGLIAIIPEIELKMSRVIVKSVWKTKNYKPEELEEDMKFEIENNIEEEKIEVLTQNVEEEDITILDPEKKSDVEEEFKNALKKDGLIAKSSSLSKIGVMFKKVKPKYR